MKKIALDAGHGLKTPGKQTPDKIKEWSLNDNVRDRVVEILKDYEVDIIHTDNDEGNVDETLGTRINRYINEGVDAFVSIHHNATTGDWNNVTGVEVYVDNNCTAKDLELANLVYKRMVKYIHLRGRGVKHLNFAVINQNRIPAILCEGGFMDSIIDYKVITSSSGKQAYAKAIAEGLIEFLDLKKKTTTPEIQNGTITDAKDLVNLRPEELVVKIGPLFTVDQTKTGVLASVSMAQFILESGYAKSELAQKANNCFGMKTSLSGNTWGGSVWNGDVYSKTTSEFVNGEYKTITADFRKYPSIEHSIEDHSAYLVGAMNGSNKRYAGLKGETDYKKAFQIIKDGEYATAPNYVDNLCSVVEKWGLTKYDIKSSVVEKEETNITTEVKPPFTVKVIVDDLNYRAKPSMEGKVRGQTGKGVFTIVEVSDGWGRLKSGIGWIWLGNPSYCTILTGVTTPKKTIDEIAREVIAGEWGNGEDRKKTLTAKGYDYDAVQKRVNDLI